MAAPKPRRRLYGARGATSNVANYILWNMLTADWTDDDDLSNDELESQYYPDRESGDSTDDYDEYVYEDYEFHVYEDQRTDD